MEETNKVNHLLVVSIAVAQTAFLEHLYDLFKRQPETTITRERELELHAIRRINLMVTGLLQIAGAIMIPVHTVRLGLQCSGFVLVAAGVANQWDKSLWMRTVVLGVVVLVLMSYAGSNV